MKKRIIALLLCVMMLLSMMANASIPVETPEDGNVNICEICNADPCTCTPVESREGEQATTCETCGADPCTCEQPELCEVCNADPCTCETDEGDEGEQATTCETCGVDPCTCEQEEVTPSPNVSTEPSTTPEATTSPVVEGDTKTEEEVVPPTPSVEPTICTVCNADPCTCETDEGDEGEQATTCEICNADPCTCEKAEEVVIDYAALYEKLMAAENIQSFDAELYSLTKEQFAEFYSSLTEEQITALDTKSAELEAKASDSEDETEVEETEEVDDREIAYETKTYTNAAPFKDPVVGEVASTWSLRKAVMLADDTAETDNGLELNKTVSEPDTDGVYTLTLEAWATGAKTIIQQESNVPTDIILVLDQSGSMANSFTSTIYTSTNETNPAELYSDRNNLYVKIGNNTYAPVSVSRGWTNGEETYNSYSGQYNYQYYDNRANLYHKCSDTQYGKVTVSRSGSIGDRTYTYTCANGCTTLGTVNDAFATPNFSNSLYRLSAEQVRQYTFSYEDESGVVHTESVTANETAPSWDFYISSAGGNTTRIAALKSAVTTFSNNVATKAKGADGVLGTDDDVHHTISVVGFGSGNLDSGTDYQNTEVFVGASQYQYGTSATNQYTNVPQDMATSAGVANVTASINSLASNGGTYVDCGMELANGILNANPVPSGEKRNRVVIVFTDGAPGYDGSYSNNPDYGRSGDGSLVASAAITQANTTKTTYGATVYTVGIFTGADATSAGSNASNASATQRANWFMQNLSSNNGTVQTPSYYLSASDSSALTSIFKTISENIESGGSSITLDEEAVVKDVITDQFTLPAGADADDIKVYTADYTAENTFAEPVEFDATVSISEDGKTVSVTNFDYAENWVGTETAANGDVTYRGKKLIIEIPIVEREGFLGGNGVLTNGEGSGVYEDSSASEPIEEFESPTVDVVIDDIAVTVPDKNVYLLGGATAAELEAALDVKVGNVTLDMDAENYGLAAWQYAYVTIGDENGAASDYTNLTADQTYSVTVTVEPNTSGEATAKTQTGTGKINVYKPVVTFNDSVVEYNSVLNSGDVTGYFNNTNKGTIVWKHGDTVASEAMGTAPTLVMTYAYASGIDSTGKITATADIPVKVTVAIGTTDVTAATTFAHGCDCAASELTPDDWTCSWNETTLDGDPAFLLHVVNIYGNLTITKNGIQDVDHHAATDSSNEERQSTIFEVKDATGKVVTTVVIHGNGSVTIKELKVGNYTVTEKDWSWRYTPDATSQTAVVDADGAEVVFKNGRTIQKWLNGGNYAVNIFSEQSN